MIEVDGGEQSGSGTIVRYSLALATLLQQEVHVYNIRAKRPNPGLRAQHVSAAKALAELSQGESRGAEVGSREMWYRPGGPVLPGSYEWDVGTAGSTTMLALALLPVACFAAGPCSFRLTGGLFQDFAPSPFHMERALLPLLGRMGVRAEIRVVRPGYLPSGGGIIELRAEPAEETLRALTLPDQPGPVRRMSGIALSSHLKQRRVSERMAERCRQVLARHGYAVEFGTIYDETAPQAGAALALFAETDNGCLLGADRAGAPRRTSEAIGEFVARRIVQEIESGATLDRHCADQLVLFAALAAGTTSYRAPLISEHVETNLWLVQRFLGASFVVNGNQITVSGRGY